MGIKVITNNDDFVVVSKGEVPHSYDIVRADEVVRPSKFSCLTERSDDQRRKHVFQHCRGIIVERGEIPITRLRHPCDDDFSM